MPQKQVILIFDAKNFDVKKSSNVADAVAT